MAERRRRGSPAARPLSSDDVVRAALDLVDEAGVSGFTMRALAARLGTYPATLYWHVGNRNDILGRVLELVLAEMTVPAPSSMAWDKWLAAVAREYRRALHLHPNTAVLALYPLVTSADYVEMILSVLRRGGFTGPILAYAFNAWVGSLTGWVSVELSVGSGEADQKWRDEFEESIRALSVESYPTIAGNLDDLADEAFTLRWHGGAGKPLDDSFEAALAVWLDGLRALRRRSRRKPD